MIAMGALDSLLQRPKASLVLGFVVWKALLFIIALTSPGLGYDTSTTLLNPDSEDLSRPFVRWDAIYFTQIAQRGYLFEQDWAFSWGFTRLTFTLSDVLRTSNISHGPFVETWTGITIAHISHFISVILLHNLSLELFQAQKGAVQCAFITAFLHIISPAGLFLSAPYSESLFSALQFCGCWLYVRSAHCNRNENSLLQDALLLFSGIAFGLATMVRSNGVFSGIPYAYDALISCFGILRGQASLTRFTQLAVIGFAGSFIAIGAAIPQIIAYREYCLGDFMRPWCENTVPSIYTFVQNHYWVNGFLRYWTVSNIPLFVLAAPTLAIMAKSCQWAWDNEPPWSFGESSQSSGSGRDQRYLLRMFAIPQAVLVAMMLLVSNVQIVTRLSSGYPVWYWWLASKIVEEGDKERDTRSLAKIACRWMMMYAIVQGGLYSSFLPPA